jgi:hypothetical protein
VTDTVAQAKCEQCGKPFLATRPWQRFDSNQCRNDFWNQVNKEARDEILAKRQSTT